jgi:hypothetical protein
VELQREIIAIPTSLGLSRDTMKRMSGRYSWILVILYCNTEIWNAISKISQYTCYALVRISLSLLWMPCVSEGLPMMDSWNKNEKKLTSNVDITCRMFVSSLREFELQDRLLDLVVSFHLLEVQDL